MASYYGEGEYKDEGEGDRERGYGSMGTRVRNMGKEDGGMGDMMGKKVGNRDCHGYLPELIQLTHDNI